MKQRDPGKLLLQALLLCVAGIIVMKMLGIDPLVSAFFMMTFPLTVLLWLWSIRRGLKITDWIMMITALLAVLFVLIDLAINGGRFRLSYFRKVIMFIMTMMFLQAMDKTKPDWYLAEFLQVIVDILTLLMAAMYVLFRDEMFTIYGTVSRYLTLGFNNPNTAAMYLAPMFMLTFCTLCKPGKPKEKTFRKCILALQVLFILDTQSRNALLASCLFTVAVLCVTYRDRIQEKCKIRIRLRFNKWIAIAIAVFPIVFASLYMLLIGGEWVEKVFSFLVSEGKGLDSRVKEWLPAFRVIGDSPFIGSYYTLSGGSGVSQMHSTHVDTAASYGIPVLLLMCYMQATYIYQRGKEYKSEVNFLYMVAFCCSLLMGTFEAATYSGGLGIYVYAMVFLALSRSGRYRRREGETYGWEWILCKCTMLKDACKARFTKK